LAYVLGIAIKRIVHPRCTITRKSAISPIFANIVAEMSYHCDNIKEIVKPVDTTAKIYGFYITLSCVVFQFQHY
jgi:hypothetical protein